MSIVAANEEMIKKIESLNRAAWQARVSDSDKAHQKSTEAAELSRKINYSKGLADGLTIEGFGCIRKSAFAEASACLHEAFSIYQSSGDLRGLAVVYEYMGIIQRYKGDGAALENIFKALELSRQTNFTDNEVTNLYQLGVTYRHLAKYDKALDYLFDSLALAKSCHFTLMEAYNLHVIGSIYFETGDYEQALNYFKPGLVIRQQEGDEWGEAGSLDTIGFTHLKLNIVSVRTKKCQEKIEIQVQDNGMGILKSLVDKIFQPFFTTKPTGQGTGFGLSLSYHIIKAHGSELKVESTEGEGATFTIYLPG